MKRRNFSVLFDLSIFIVRLIQSYVKYTPIHKEFVFTSRKNNLEVQAKTCFKK